MQDVWETVSTNRSAASGHDESPAMNRRSLLQGATAAGSIGLLTPDGRADQSKPSLRQIAEAAGIYFGCAVNHSIFEDDAFSRLVIEQCNIIVCEGAMKLHTLCPYPWIYDFTTADRIVAYANRYSMSVRGHTLVWGGNMLRWFEDEISGPNGWRAFERYITDVVTHFRGQLICWDVINEPMSDSESDLSSLKSNTFLENLGPDYIKVAFDVAHAIDPDSKLYLNDYFFAHRGSLIRYKFRNTLKLLDSLQSRNTAIHGVGLQSHIFTSGLHDRAESIDFLKEIERRGLEISVTEMDVTDNRSVPAPYDQDEIVATLASEYLDRLCDVACVKALVTWGLSDRYTWLRVGKQRERQLRPLPYDEQFNPKLFRESIHGYIFRRSLFNSELPDMQ